MSPKPPPAGGAAVDALLDPAFLENATAQPMSEVRRLRREAEQQEVNLSYTRRLLQGRLDIVRREVQRRAEHDGRSLVDLLPEILSEKGRGPAHGLGRHQTVQPHAPEEYENWVNGLTGSIDMSDISDLSDAKLEKAARALAEAESGLSERRRGVQQVMDGLAAELGRRYRDGEADVAALLADEGRRGPPRRSWRGRGWPENPVLVEVWRSGFFESAHRGSLVVLDADGAVSFAAGAVDRPILPRSSNKPVQATALLAAGWMPRSPAELAIGAGSHNGEDGHRELVAAMLAAVGLDPEALACPPALPQHELTRAHWLAAGRPPDRLAMNCSGKHAAMLSACVAAGWPTDGLSGPRAPAAAGDRGPPGRGRGGARHRRRRRRVRRAAARAVGDRSGARGAVAGAGARGKQRSIGGRRHARGTLVRGRQRPRGHRPDARRPGAAREGRRGRGARGRRSRPWCGRAEAGRRR